MKKTKLSHEKASVIFNSLKNTQFYVDGAKEAIKNAEGNYSLEDVAEGYAIKYYGFPEESLLSFLEGLYSALKTGDLKNAETNPGKLDADDLFKIAIDKLLDIAESQNRKELAGYVNSIYAEE